MKIAYQFQVEAYIGPNRKNAMMWATLRFEAENLSGAEQKVHVVNKDFSITEIRKLHVIVDGVAQDE